MAVTIDGVQEKSLAAKKKIMPGDSLLSINGHEIVDVLDYQFYIQESKLCLEIQTAKRIRKIHIRKKEEEDIGLEFSTYLMDQQHSCRNNCIFCFIDQLPPGMRETLYFKDDDSRLSFLFGNYITLTNLSEHEIQRIIDMHISPVNISVHTTDPELRCKMMNNRFAGDSLKIIRRFADAGLAMNIQLVLCPGYNDGENLTKTMEDLTAFLPAVQSIAAVPVGLTKYREGLTPLRLFTPEECADVVDRMEKMGDRMLKEHGIRLFYPSDEFYLKAQRKVPDYEFYGEFLQLENGVGMYASFRKQFQDALEDAEGTPIEKKITIVTGKLAEPLIKNCVEMAKEKYPQLDIDVFAIRNDFFGETITVTGLVTGGDIYKQIDGKCGDILLIPSNMLRRERDLFLDDMSVTELEAKLNTQIIITDCEGDSLVASLME